MNNMSYLYTGQAIISGLVNGKKFRPSNWPERICEAGASYDPIKGVMRYSPYLNIALDDEHGYCVQVDFDALVQHQPELYQYVTWFIKSNHLMLVAHHRVATTTPQTALQQQMVAQQFAA